MEKVILCEKCRHMVSPRDVVCPYCGSRLIKKSRTKREDKKKDRAKKKSSNLMYIIELAPLILVMSGVCGFYLLTKDGKPQWLSNEDYPAETALTETAAPSETDIPEAALAAEPTPETTPEPEITPEPTPEITPEPTPVPTPRQADTPPDKHGHTGKTPPIFTEYTSSSAAEDVYSVLHAFDGSMDNVWGAGGENGGIKEWIMMSAEEYQAVSGVRIFNGNTQSEEAFNDNARAKIVELSFSDGSYERRILQDGFSRNEPYIIRLSERINTKYVKITILDKYGKSDMVCIGEIEVF